MAYVEEFYLNFSSERKEFIQKIDLEKILPEKMKNIKKIVFRARNDKLYEIMKNSHFTPRPYKFQIHREFLP